MLLLYIITIKNMLEEYILLKMISSLVYLSILTYLFSCQYYLTIYERYDNG